MLGRAARRLLLTICLLIALVVLYNARYRSEEIHQDGFDEDYSGNERLPISKVPQHLLSIQKHSFLHAEHRKISNGLVETVSLP